MWKTSGKVVSYPVRYCGTEAAKPQMSLNECDIISNKFTT